MYGKRALEKSMYAPVRKKPRALAVLLLVAVGRGLGRHTGHLGRKNTRRMSAAPWHAAALARNPNKVGSLRPTFTRVSLGFNVSLGASLSGQSQ